MDKKNYDLGNFSNSIMKYFGLKTSNNTMKIIDNFLEKNYKNIVFLVFDELDFNLLKNNSEGDSFLTKNKLCDVKTTISYNKLKSVVEMINENTDYSSYGLLPDGIGSYESINMLYTQIINLCSINKKKFIYAYARKNFYSNININEYIKKLIDNLQDTLLVITTDYDKITLLPLIVIENKEDLDDGIIREAKFSDYKAVKRIADDIVRICRKKRKDIFVLSASYSQNYFYELTEKKDDSLCLVYEFNKEIVGIIELIITSTYGNEKYNYINSLVINKIAVKSEYRRQKIATKLYNYALNYAKKRKLTNIKINNYSFNEEAQKFIESLGMKEFSIEYEFSLNK